MELMVSGIQTPSFMQKAFRSEFSISRGIHLIRGDNGVGKSVFMNSLIGLYGPTPNVTLANGRDGRLSYFNQDSYVTTDSLRWNLFLDNEILDSSIEVEKLAQDLLVKFGLPRAMHNLDMEIAPHLLSGGQIKKIGLIRSLLKQADFYLLDEPTNDLDHNSLKVLISLINETAKRASVLIISHDQALSGLPHSELDIFRD